VSGDVAVSSYFVKPKFNKILAFYFYVKVLMVTECPLEIIVSVASPLLKFRLEWFGDRLGLVYGVTLRATLRVVQFGLKIVLCS
jgi:hypothetical protein